jgi:hypothetical protein
VRELLKALTDLAGAVITIDALHTQADTAQAILDRQSEAGTRFPAKLCPDYHRAVGPCGFCAGNHTAGPLRRVRHSRRGQQISP